MKMKPGHPKPKRKITSSVNEETGATKGFPGMKMTTAKKRKVGKKKKN